jgi:hypothetical protein
LDEAPVNSTKELEALDKKYGRPITIADWSALGEKSADQLTDDDLVIVENFGGPRAAAAARARRTLALNRPRCLRRRTL